jgi:hypothetical protein
MQILEIPAVAKTDRLLTYNTINKVYGKTIDVVFAFILLFITLTMIIGVVSLFYRIGELFQPGGITGNYLHIISEVLTDAFHPNRIVSFSGRIFHLTSPAYDSHYRRCYRLCAQA